jgi:predicted SAM-dependent methyltransferase
MKSQQLKDMCYAVCSPVLRLNLLRHRTLPKRSGNELKINIGSGRSRFKGWLNIDGNLLSRPDFWLDMRYGLPFRSGSVKHIYSCHFFEHLYLEELEALLLECKRVLRPDGGMRMAMPNMLSAVQMYFKKDMEWFNGFPREFHTPGGRLFNEMFCGGQHRIMFDYDFLEELLANAGFKTIYEVKRGESKLLDGRDETLIRELTTANGSSPDPWLLAEARP